MNGAPHLLNEDRGDYERVLDEALRAYRRNLATVGSTLTTEQLRSMTLSATTLITSAAAEEYQHYVTIRRKLRTPARTTQAPRARRAVSNPSAGSDTDSRSNPPVDTGATADADSARGDFPDLGDSSGLGDSAGSGDSAHGAAGPTDPAEPAGAGLAAVLAVLAPLLAGAAAVIFLLVGYALHMAGPAPAVADTLRTTGWVFAAITAAAILIAAIGLLLTALRNGSTSLRADDRRAGNHRTTGTASTSGTANTTTATAATGAAGATGATGADNDRDRLDEQVRRARQDWHRALLERGIRPFLQEVLGRSQPAGLNGRDPADEEPEPKPGPKPRPEPTSRIPHLGYHRPGFTSPDGGPAAAPRPRYTSPDFSSPDFGGPEHRPE